MPAPALIEQLQEFLSTWPRDPLAVDVVKWLDQLSVATEAYVSAARSLTAVSLARSDDTWMRTAYDRWTTAIARSEPVARQALADEAIKRFQQPANDMATCLSLQLSLLCLPANQVQPITKPAFALLQQRGCFLWLAQARGLSFLNGEAVSNKANTSEGLTADERSLAIDRLVEDARPSPTTQPSQTELQAIPQPSPLIPLRVGKALIEIDRVQALPLNLKIQAYDWASDFATSRSLIPANLQANDEFATSIASVLSSSGNTESRRAGLSLWNQIAARLPLGSAGWHRAKLAILDLLVTSNQQGEASRLANYVLLTQAPVDPIVRARYQAYLVPSQD